NTGTITDSAQTFNLTKELTGTLILSSANTYDGSTLINQGVLSVQNSNALGGVGLGEVQQYTVSGFTGTYTLSFKGQTTDSLAFNATPAQIQAELNNLSSIGGVGGSVTVVQTGTPEVQSVDVTGLAGTFTLTFRGQTTGAISVAATDAQVQAAFTALSTVG